MPALSRTQSVVVALIVAGAFSMEYIDSTVIATALPLMARSFGIPAVSLSIGLTAYLLTLAAFIPISGWVADRFGSRTVFVAAMALFTGASVLCGLCDGLTAFVAARVVQGIGGAMMVPVGRFVVLRTTEKKDLINAMALLSWPALAAPVLGPPLGGFIATTWSWRWIFFLNVPFGLIGIVAALRMMPNLFADRRRRFDPVGFLLTGGALACVMFGMDRIGVAGADRVIPAATLVIGGGLGTLAVRHCRRHPEPLIDLWPMRLPTFAATTWGGSLFRITISAAPFLVPLMLELGFGMSAFEAGAFTLWIFVGNLGMKVFTTPILRHFGFRATLVTTGVAAVLSLAVCAVLPPTTSAWLLAAVLCYGGLCRSMQFTAISTLTYVDVPAERMSDATAFGSLVQQMTQGVGVASGALMLHLAMALGGRSGAPTTADFHLAFVFMTVIALFGLISFVRLAPDAGALVSGHKVAAD
jgi:EmrB/QacA subfamily drug resistance transporter